MKQSPLCFITEVLEESTASFKRHLKEGFRHYVI